MELWLEIGKLTASIATPIVVAIIGVMLLRRIEGVKALVSTQSDFRKKWADEFFVCCQQLLQAMERDLALLNFFVLQELSGELSIEVQKEISSLSPKLSELELRIRRCVVFAPASGEAVAQAAKECTSLMARLLKEQKGNLDELIEKMNEFNVASRKAHAEMLGLG